MNPALHTLPRARLEEALASLDASIRALEAQGKGDPAGLARLELRMILEELTKRITDPEPAGDVERLPSSWANGLTSLPMRWRASKRRSHPAWPYSRAGADLCRRRA